MKRWWDENNWLVEEEYNNELIEGEYNNLLEELETGGENIKDIKAYNPSYMLKYTIQVIVRHTTQPIARHTIQPIVEVYNPPTHKKKILDFDKIPELYNLFQLFFFTHFDDPRFWKSKTSGSRIIH